MNKEKLKEAAENYTKDGTKHFMEKTNVELGFEEGAKWQSERMYSEEDMAEAFIACWKANVPDGIECKVSFNEWFEQFKKK